MSILRWLMLVLVAAAVCLLFIWTVAFAHDKHHADSQSPEMKKWFDTLKSGKGPCCSDADGSVVKDADWRSNDGHYQVYINKEWIDVPDDAVLKQPNMYGRTMVWTGLYINGLVQIRCFIPGQMT